MSLRWTWRAWIGLGLTLVVGCGIPPNGDLFGDGPPTVRRGGDPQEERCLDGVDNDRDGQVDEDCGQPEPVDAGEDRCFDGVDNDLDGEADEGCAAPDPGGADGRPAGEEPAAGADGGQADPADPPQEEAPAGDGGEGDEAGEDDGGDDGTPGPDEPPEEEPGEGDDGEGDGGEGDGGEEDGGDEDGGEEDPGEQACPEGRVFCEEDCRDLLEDKGHCGGCGNACDEGEVCEEGRCQPLPEEEPPGDDRLEDNDDPDSATEIAPPASFADLVALPDDGDWFRIAGCEQGQLVVRAEFELPGDEAQLLLRVLTEDREVQPFLPLLSEEPVQVGLPAAEPYFLTFMADGPAPAGIAYSFQVSLDCPEQNDAVDGDGDGHLDDVDCDDANVLINPGAAELCDGEDNDCDGDVDEGTAATCDDGDNCTIDACTAGACTNQPEADCGGGQAAGTCADPTLQEGPGELTGATDDALASEHQGSCGGDGHEHVFRYTSQADGIHAFDTTDSTFDTLLYIRSDCEDDQGELECSDDGGGGLASRVELFLNDGQEVFVFVDGVGPADAGEFTLQVTDD